VTSATIYILTAGLIFCFICYLSLEFYKIENKKRLDNMLNFTVIMSILDFHVKKAFEIIYKEKILIYSMEATKPSQAEFETISKDFARLVMKLLGPNFLESLVSLYGNEETLLFNLMEMFNTFFENDEIYKSTSNQIMESELI
jgi:hypothetical protein